MTTASALLHPVARDARAAWDFPAGRHRLLDSFITGYLRSRGQTAASMATTRYGACVRYAPGMDRGTEHFVTESAASLALLRPHAGDWVTLLGTPAERLGGDDWMLREQAREFFMATQLEALQGRLAGAPLIAGLDSEGQPVGIGVRVFSYAVGDSIVASLRCARGRQHDVVIDRVQTDPAWRGRGLARGLMRAATQWALGQGAARMLLIASPEGHRLYQRLGFETIVPVRVMVVEAGCDAAGAGSRTGWLSAAGPPC